MLVVLFLGSPGDRPFARRIVTELEKLGLAWQAHVASAHKTPRHVLDLLERYEADPQPKVYVAVAGRSNALGGLVDAQVSAPVIACPPYAEQFAGWDVLSSLRMPSGVAPAVVLEPENAALLAAKILGLTDPGVRRNVQAAQAAQRQRVMQADKAGWE